ncbi:ribosome biogenesis GTPase YqeH [Geomicrobium sediminis]|uniref:Ribosome biogenesis GTPase YqeH n=1 Tax=Geomicrobium sediminis TaxID=1347788 RepID=A0ABS2PED9_9BACL|nr:ribosome biogenesis GTPase YqeH [Geomicrobium sediminis]MBM7633789.1 ribosome biogenesis GTPase YqeH [Geomicrobium sediminis]
MNEQIICSGCGIPVQTKDSDKPGYAPKAALERDVIVCQRCYRLTHYNEVPDVPLTDKDFDKLLDDVSKSDALVVMIVDLFDVEGSWMMKRKDLNHLPLVIVGNKFDLLPHSVNENKIKLWLKKEAMKRGYKPEKIDLMSANKKADVMRIAALIDQVRNGKDVYIIGSANVGKSTFINQIIRAFDGDEDQLITTSIYPGTTLAFIDLPLDDGSKMYDTPGIINPNQMYRSIPQKEMKLLQPKREIKPIVFQLKEEQTLFIGSLARFDFVSGEANHFVCYFPEKFTPHRTKLSQADDLYARHKGETILSPPSKESLEEVPPLKAETFTIAHDKTDIVIPGLGWVTVGHKGAVVTVHAPENIKVTLREAII